MTGARGEKVAQTLRMDTSLLPLDLPHAPHAPPAPPLPLPSAELSAEPPPVEATDESGPASDTDEAQLCSMLIRQIRRRTKLTQIAFTRRYGIPLGTFRDWEQGRTKPDATARSYLALIAKAPEEIAALIGD